MFDGQRLAACSDVAQLYWPRLFCAANGYARLELHYPTIAGRCFHGFRQVPTEDQVFAVVKEYADNFLVIPYHADGQLWIQFATLDKFLRRRKTADDERSPAPPPRQPRYLQRRVRGMERRTTIDEQWWRWDVFQTISDIFPKSFRRVSARSWSWSWSWRWCWRWRWRWRAFGSCTSVRGHALCRTFRRFSTYRSSGIKSTEYRRSYSTSFEKRIRGSLSWRNWAGCVRGSSQTRPR